MKKSLYLACLVLLLASCQQQGSNGVKFQPKERESSLTDEERKEAIAEKKASLELNPEVMLFQHNLKLSVVGPAPHDEITEATSVKVVGRLMQIACQNGVAATGDSPCFGLACLLTPVAKEATGTAPQRMICSYDAVLFVGNFLTGEIYTGITQRITGAGSTFEEAATNAADNIENNSDVQQMLQSAETIIVSWFEENVDVFRNEIEAYVSQHEYEMAFAMLRSVPKQATQCFDYANSHLANIERQMLSKHANEQLREMEDAIAQAGGKYNPTVAASYRLIPDNTEEHKKAERLWEKYTTTIEQTRKDSIAWEKHKYQEELETERLRMKYSFEATKRTQEDAAQGKLSRVWRPAEKKGGFFKDENGKIKWGNVAWTAAGVALGGIALVGAAGISVASTILSHSLFIFGL